VWPYYCLVETTRIICKSTTDYDDSKNSPSFSYETTPREQKKKKRGREKKKKKKETDGRRTDRQTKTEKTTI